MKQKRLFSSSRDGKIRRKILKAKRSSQSTSNQRREGTTYQSDIGLSSMLDIPIERVPTVPVKSNAEKVKKFKLVFFDTETTGLSTKDEIIQVYF